MDNDVSQTPELSLSDSSTRRVRQGERRGCGVPRYRSAAGNACAPASMQTLEKDCDAQLYTYKSHVKQ